MKVERSKSGFSLIEVMVSMTLLAVFALGLGLATQTAHKQLGSISEKADCTNFVQNLRSSIWNSNNALYVRNRLPLKYNNPSPYPVTDTNDVLTSGVGRAYLEDSVPFFVLDGSDFVEYNAPRFTVTTYQNIRGAGTWAVNLHNACGPCRVFRRT